MSEHIERADDFFAEVLRYLDGEMPADEARRFERRIESDPELRERYDEIADLDMLERVTRAWAPPERGRGPRPILRWALVIAASALALLGLRELLSGPERAEPLDLRVAALPVDASLESYNERLGLSGDWLPPGYGLMGAPEEQDAPREEEYVERVRELESARIDAALASESAGPIPVARFVVPFRAERDVWALCVLSPDDGAARLLEPAPGEAARRFEGGRAHVLPRPTVALPAQDERGGDRRELFDWGYKLAPTTREAVVLLALRSEPPDSATLAELRALLGTLGAEARVDERARRLREWLEQRGFAVRGIPLAGEE